MIGTIISLPLSEWIIIFSLLIGFKIYLTWNISKYKELVEKKNIWFEIAQLRKCQLITEKRRRNFMIYDKLNNIIYENIDNLGL